MSFDVSRTDSFSEKQCIQEKASPIPYTELGALDVGLALVVDCIDDVPVTPTQSKQVRRKIDLHILPLLFLIYTGVSDASTTVCDTDSF